MRIYKCDRCLKEMTISEMNSTRPISSPGGTLNEFCKNCEVDFDIAFWRFHKEFMSHGKRPEETST